MRIETSLNYEKQFKTRASDIFHSARIMASSHSEILARVKAEIYEHEAYRRCPGWVHERVKQCLDDFHSRIYQPDLSASQLVRVVESGDVSSVPWVKWTLRVDGVECDSGEISARRAFGDEDIWSRVEGAHIWNHKPESCYSDGWKKTC